jgi:hypothetical protein
MAGAAGPPILALIPESRDSFTYGKTLVGSFNSDDETLKLVQTFARPVEIATATGVTVARSATAGNVWTVFDADDDPYEGSYLYEWNAATGALVRKAKMTSLVPLPAGQHIPKLAERAGYHAFYALDCDTFLTVDRRTGRLIRIKLVKGAAESDYWKAVLDKTFKLTLVPADFAVNADGTRVVYCKNSGLHLWDLEKDVFLRTIYRAA